MDNPRWRGDGGNHFLWDFIAPEIKAALFVVECSGGHQVPERELPGNRQQTGVCDGGKGFNSLKGKKRIQKDRVHIRRHAKDRLKGYETVSEALDWRWLRWMKSAADRVLKVAKLSMGKERDRKATGARRRVEALLRRGGEGEPAGKLKRYLPERGEELEACIGNGGRTDSNPAEPGIRFHISGKRKVSGGSRTLGGAQRTTALVSVQATARMRSVPFPEVGRRGLRGDPDPLSSWKGPHGPRGPEQG